MSNLNVNIEEGTYEIVHGISFTEVDNNEEENEIETSECLDFDMENIDDISDNTYYSTIDESQHDNITFDKKTIVTQAYLTAPTTKTTTTTNDDELYDNSNTIRRSSQRLKRKRTNTENNNFNNKNTSSIMKVINTNVTNGNDNIIQLNNNNINNKTTKINPNILPVDSTISNNNQNTNSSLLNNTTTTTTTTPTNNKTDNVDNDIDNVDIFFQSMTHSVLQLPLQVQAKIKMDICKIVSLAEIKYFSDKSENSNNS